MKTKLVVWPWAFGLCLLLPLGGGCELVVDFDRDLIDSGGDPMGGDGDEGVDATVPADAETGPDEDAGGDSDGGGDGDDSVVVCGDGQTEGNESCDDGNTTTETIADCDYDTTCTDFCNADCSAMLSFSPMCGDGLRYVGEEMCDDGNSSDPTDCAYGLDDCALCKADCSALLTDLPIHVCGDGTEDTANGDEVCDDGNMVTEVEGDCPYGTGPCTFCNATCQDEFVIDLRCGDDDVHSSETCDDGNTTTEVDSDCPYGTGPCTFCDATCENEFVIDLRCGDNDVHSSETCDDGDMMTETESDCPYGTGPCTFCDAACENEFVIDLRCGDGDVHSSESCDDMNDSACGLCADDCMGVQALASATGVLTVDMQVSDGNRVTIGSKIYTFRDAITTADGDVDIGATPLESMDNLIAAINLTGTAGTTYGLDTTLNTDVTASARTVDDPSDVPVTAIAVGSLANAIVTTSNGGQLSWALGTLGGGAGRDCAEDVGCTDNDDCESGTCTAQACTAP